MNVPYIAIDPTFPHHLNSFDNVPVNYSAGELTNITVKSYSQTSYSNIINYTQQASGKRYKTFQTPLSRNKILLYMTSLFSAGSNEGGVAPFRPLNLSITSTVISES